MIVYRATKKEFQEQVELGVIDRIILENFKKKLHRSTSDKEVDSWWNSLNYMSKVIDDDAIPENTGIAIECQIPQTSKRIDFILSGISDDKKSNVVIIELKQWKQAELTDKHGIIKTALGKGLRETSHPSYQAWSYAAILQDFSETVYQENIQLVPCAYLHNYEEDEVIRNPFYDEYLQKAPVFLKRDMIQLRAFIKKYVKQGDDGKTMYRIDKGKIRPSKQLADSLVNMIRGNREFVLVDEQKLVYETAVHLVNKAEKDKSKHVLIVEGGPGTGKSVVAINLLVEITRLGMLTQYVTKNAAPRAVYESKLTGELNKSRFGALFKSSGSYVDAKINQFNALVVDEAHRLNEKSGLFSNLGENQIKEIIHASKCSIFFIDEDQRVTLKDIGNKEEIKKWAEKAKAYVHEYELPSQFRCNGSDGFLAFIDQALQIRETANISAGELDYDFRVFDNPKQLFEEIKSKNQIDGKSRMVAGYCWDWLSKKDSKAYDIVFPEYNFKMQWNLTTDGSAWIIRPESINQIGCIHTCQGLEATYIGVIIGPDLIVRNGKVLVDPAKRSKMDGSIKGYKTLLKDKPEEAKEQMRMVIKNTYRTLMTRGMKGCYIYSVDKETNDWVKSLL